MCYMHINFMAMGQVPKGHMHYNKILQECRHSRHVLGGIMQSVASLSLSELPHPLFLALCSTCPPHIYRLNPKDKKQFWKAVKYLNKQQSNSNQEFQHSAIKIPLLGQSTYFFSACNRDIPPLSPADIGQHAVQYSSCPGELLCTIDEVLFLIKSLDS